jgi:leader peptidase (prepilin peptidase) / N-methyltransferase
MLDPFLEIGCGALCALVASRVPSLWEVPAFSVLAAGLITLSVVDLDCRRLPTPIVYGTGVVTGLLLVPAAGALGAWCNLGRAGIGAGVTFGAFVALSLIFPKGLGFGDVRLSAVCGGIVAWIGYGDLLLGLLISSGVGTIVASVALVRRKGGTSIPFGPCLAVGTIVAIVIGPSLLTQ